jgi:predicted transcriptional regulator
MKKQSDKLYAVVPNIIRDRRGYRRLRIIDDALAKRLTDFRLDHGWTLKEMEVQTGVSRSVLSRVELGDRSLTPRIIRKLQRFLERMAHAA